MIPLSSHRRRAGAAVALLAAALAFTGCTSAVQTATTSSASSAPVQGGTLAIAASADAQPQFVMANRAGNWSWRRLVFESLVVLDSQQQPQPLLATTWQYDADRTQLTLTLRDDVKFSSGRPFTADDVVFSLEQAKDPKNASQLGVVAKNISSAAAKDAHTVVLQLAAPSDSMFDLLDLIPMVDKDTWAGIADGKQVIGTGPFLWSSWTPGASITLKKNPEYRDPKRPYLDEVDVSIITDSTAVTSALKSGTDQLAIGMAQSDVSLLKSSKDYQLLNAGGVFYPLGVDVTMAPFDKLEVRQALSLAIDRDRIAQQVFGGDATATNLWWTPGSPGYPADLSKSAAYDPKKAASLLDTAGAKGTEITITYANIPTMKSLFEIVQNNLTEAGFTVHANALDTAAYDKAQVAGQLGQAFLLLHGMVGFSSATIIDAMPSIKTGNPSQFAAPEYDTLKAAVRGADDSSRAEALKKLSTYMLDQSFSDILTVAPQYHVASAQLHGVSVVSLGSVVATDAYLSKK